MIQKELIKAVSSIKSSRIKNLRVNYFDENTVVPLAEVTSELDNNTSIQFSFWRLIEKKGTLSFLDHNQKYGGPTLINAYEYLLSKISKEAVVDVSIDSETGDIVLKFKDFKLQIFKLNGYENWSLRLPSGAVEYSNYVETEIQD